MSHRLSRFINHLQPSTAFASDSGVIATRVLSSGVGVIEINNPPVNSWSSQVMAELPMAVTQMENDPAVHAVIITGKGKFFMAGADIRYLQKLQRKGDAKAVEALVRDAHKVCASIESGRKPYVAAVNGAALGGGCELAMACNYRVASESARLGQVEAGIGLIPGYGGTQRMTRLIGFQQGIWSVVHGATYSARSAHTLGLIDEVASDRTEMMKQAETAALEMYLEERMRRRSLYLEDKIPNRTVGRKMVTASLKRFGAALKHSPQGTYGIRAVEGTLRGPIEGIECEIENFVRVMMTSFARAQVHLFFAERATSKLKALRLRSGGLAREVRVVGVVCGSAMESSDIVATETLDMVVLLVARGNNVVLVLHENMEEELARNSVDKNLSAMSRSMKRDDAWMRECMDRVAYTWYYRELCQCDVVIENERDELRVKREVFSELVRVCRPDCILATTSSVIRVDSIAMDMGDASRVIGLHFPKCFRPGETHTKVLEISAGESTPINVVAGMSKWSKKLGLTPLVCQNRVGLVANRMLSVFWMTCDFLIEYGCVTPYRIDDAFEEFGMVGLHKMFDGVGLGVMDGLVKEFVREYHRGRVDTILDKMTKRQSRFGVKNGRGFYNYGGAGRMSRNDSNPLWSRRGSVMELSDEAVIEICLYPVINEACRLLQEGVCDKASDLDVVSVFCHSFPRKSGGIMFWATEIVGLSMVLQKLKVFQANYKLCGDSFSSLFEPSSALISLCSAKN